MSVPYVLQLTITKDGRAFVVRGFLKGKLVVSSFFAYNTTTCLYFSSAAESTHFNKPLNHALIWEGIKYAQKAGCNYFDFSLLSYNKGECKISKKEQNINLFKNGFGGETKIQSFIEWTNGK